VTEERPKERRKVYTREFKLEAVRLAVAGETSVAQVARDLGINENTLHKWKQQLRADPEQAFPGRGRLKPQDEELRRLRRETLKLRQEVLFLKKAAVWLAQEAHPSTD
jgi:transposase